MSRQKRDKPFLDPAALHEATRVMRDLAERAGIRAALLGGYAMQHYGSDRLTGDVDFAADAALPDIEPTGELSFGGVRYEAPNGVPVEWVLRNDEYTDLYAEALERAGSLDDGTPVVSPEHLAATKFATRRSRDHEDVVFLLQQPDLVDRERVREIVYRLVGGRFARDEFDLVIDEADWRTRKDHR